MNKQNLETLLNNLSIINAGDIMVNINGENVGIKKYRLSANNLLRTVICNLLQLVSDPLKNDTATYTSDDKISLNNFINSISDSVIAFCKFLDYDGDGVVELVRRDSHGEMTYGDDIDLLLKDVSIIANSTKNTNNATVVFSVLSAIMVFFQNEHILDSKNDFIDFKNRCVATYDTFKLVKNINHIKIFEEKADDIMSFVMILCIVILPLMELANQKIEKINNDIANNNLPNEVTFTLTREEMSLAVTNMYGINLDYILLIINNLVALFIKGIKASGFFKKICCCCKNN